MALCKTVSSIQDLIKMNKNGYKIIQKTYNNLKKKWDTHAVIPPRKKERFI